MSLATRCPTCQTAFRVVQDQLRVSDGWVRCGRCDQVFNALEGLFDLDHVGGDATPSRGAPGRDPDASAPASADPPLSPRAPIAPSREPTPDSGAWLWGTGRNPPEQLANENSVRDKVSSAPAAPSRTAPPAPTVAPTPRPTPGPTAPRRSSFFSFSSRPEPTEDISEFTAADVLDSRFFRSATEDDEPEMRLDVDLDERRPGSRYEPSLNHEQADTIVSGEEDTTEPEHAARGEDDLDLEDLLDPALIGDAEREAAAEAAAARLDSAATMEPPALDAPDDAAARSTRPGRSDRDERGRRDKDERSGKRRRRKDTVPTFVRQADRARRWESPRMRLLLSLSVSLLALMLIIQGLVIARDPLSARWPAAQPWIAGLCVPLGCEISPVRRVQDLAIDSSAFTKADTNTERYQLSLVVRNRGAHTVAAPAIELTLLDAREMVVVRRVFTPEDFSVPASLRAGGTQALNLVLAADDLSAQDLRIAGYRVLAFYP